MTSPVENTTPRKNLTIEPENGTQKETGDSKILGISIIF